MRRKIQETVTIKEMFKRLNIAEEEHANTFPVFDISVKTPYGYKRVNEFFRTETQQTVTCYFGNNKTSTSSPNPSSNPSPHKSPRSPLIPGSYSLS